MEKSDSRIIIRVSEDLKIRLEKQAEHEHRSMSNLVKVVLTDYLESQKTPKAP